jgi:hypothetical protein
MRDNDFEVFQVKTYDLFLRFLLRGDVGNHEALSGLGENNEARFISVTWRMGKHQRDVSADRQRLLVLQGNLNRYKTPFKYKPSAYDIMSEHFFQKMLREQS